ncbi:MAG TPA: recombinase family protein [Caulobacteraceae bacterium]
MAVVGYARVSSAGQSLDVQLDQLRAAGCEKVFAEKRSGTTTAGRDELEAALDWVREGDVLVVTRLDRLARSILDLRRIIDRLAAKDVGFRCLQQGAIDTTRSDGRLLLNILGSFAEFEADIRRERQADGIAKAKAKGVYRGRRPSIDIGMIEQLKARGLGPAAIAKELKIGRASVYRLIGKSVRAGIASAS